MGERRGTKALELWCRRVTEGYPGVNVCNMTTSWRDGLAFCALIHRFRPDLIDFASLRSGEARYNNELAFTVAERHLGIPALLDAEDMVDSHAPDRLSVLTYLAQYYQTFGQASLAMGIISPGRGSPATKRLEGSSQPEIPSPRQPEEAQPKKTWNFPREPCESCGLPVFLAERLKCFGRTFHRTCFKCARCGTQLSTANCYETESHAFCCEVCPDEEAKEREITATKTTEIHDTSSEGEEDSVAGSYDEYSNNFESALEVPDVVLPASDPALSAFLNGQLSQAEPITVTNSSPQLPTISNINQDDSQINEDKNLDSIKSDDEDDSCIGGNKLNCSTLNENINDENQISSGQNVNNINKDLNLLLCDSDDNSNAQKTNVNNISSDVGNSSILCSKSLELRRNSSGESSSLVSRRKSLFENLTQNEEKITVSRKSSIIIAQEDCTTTSTVNVNSDVNKLTTVVSLDDANEQENKMAHIDDNSDITESQTCDLNDEIKHLNIIGNDTKIVDEDSKLELKTEDIDTSKLELKTENIDDSKLEVNAEDINSTGKEEKAKVEIPSIRLDEVKQDDDEEEKYPQDLNPFGDEEEDVKPANKSLSTNPFGSDSEEEEEPTLRKVQPAPRKLIPVDAHLNPFWEEGMEEEVQEKPVPRPRSLRSPEFRPSPAPRRATTIVPSSPSLSVSSARKKCPAPPPPPSSAATSPTPSPRGTMRSRKSRPAPLPPGQGAPDVDKLLQLGEKGMKDELNRTRQGLVAERQAAPEKSHQGQWKRKKGPAPALPIPPRRQLKIIPMAEVRQELDMIETQQRGLEKQGVRLESQIREHLEQMGCEEDAESLPVEVEEQVLQLFELVNEKNELFRRQAELMYLKRQQRLEEQQVELEWQIRCLLQKPKKGEEEIRQEEELIARLVSVVEQRNEIVDCLEMDRKREADEDKSVRERLQMISDRQGHQAESSESDTKSKSKKTKLRLLKKDKSKKKEKKEEKKAKKTASASTSPVTSSPATPEHSAQSKPTSAEKKTKKKWFS